MADLEDDDGLNQPTPQQGYGKEPMPEPTQADKNLHRKIARTIRRDKQYHSKAFTRMRMSMRVAMRGRTDDWSENNYTANITGRHIKAKAAALYAKNPKAVARRRETLDFQIWDEDEQSLQLAMQTLMGGIQMAAQQQAQQQQNANVVDMNGQPVAEQQEIELPPGFEYAQQVVADFQQGLQRRQQATKIGKTLEVLFTHAMREQKPLTFKKGMKQLVRRACTTGVGYVEIGFQRETAPRAGLTEELADARARMDHLNRLMQDASEGEIDPDAGEMAELQRSVEALQSEPEIVLREGLIFDFPQSTKVIPDRLCKSLVGFVGARHLTIEYLFTKDEVREMFPDCDLGTNYTPYSMDGKSSKDDDVTQRDFWESDPDTGAGAGGDLCCVWKHFDKPSGLVYYLCDGYDGFLRDPAPPDVFVEDFWSIYALTFNAVESESELFPPSDVELLIPMQKEYNRSREGKREHRQAARPRWVTPTGALDEDDQKRLESAAPFTVTELNIDPGVDIKGVLQPVPIAGVDPNLYDVNEIFTDMQLTVGTQEAQLGGVSKSTATEAAIASSASSSSDGSSVDDLDGFLTDVCRASGQILLKEMSPEVVMQIVGPGALWPEMSLSDIANELFLEVEAGSTGKPNQAMEVQNWERMMPFLIQLPGIKPSWLAKETIKRLDDRLDVTEAITQNMPSMVALNQMQQPSPANPGNAPGAQGSKGAANGPAAPGGPAGTSAAFGSNQV